MEILIKVIPWSKKIDVVKEWKDLLTNRDVYRIKLTAKPVNNQANEQLIEVLSKYFKVKKRFIFLDKWATSRLKLVKIVEN
jgi:uncharacterized protein YggU (UPF0235/DUF167 family)